VIIATGQGAREHALKSLSSVRMIFREAVDPEFLRLVVERARRLFDLESELRRLAEVHNASPLDGVIGSSPNQRPAPDYRENRAFGCHGAASGESGTARA